MCCRPAGGTSPGAPLENLPNQDAVQGEGRLGSRGAWPGQVDWDHQDTGNKTFLVVGDGENPLSWQLSEQCLELVLATEPALEVSRDHSVWSQQPRWQGLGVDAEAWDWSPAPEDRKRRH